MHFVLNGFSEERGFRVFEFHGIAADHVRARKPFTVRADVALARRYGIRLQELPLLCRSVLERGHEGRDLTYTEADMRLHAEHVVVQEEAAKHSKPPRRPVSTRVGSAWRNPVSRF